MPTAQYIPADVIREPPKCAFLHYSETMPTEAAPTPLRVEAAYHRFLEAYPPRQAAGVPVYDLGEGPALVFLHGMAGDGSAWWQQLLYFKDHYRVLAPTYPEARDLVELADRILAALRELGVDRFVVVGSSMGGYLAQFLVKIVPSRVEAAVFANTFPPNDEIARKNRTLVWLARVLPEPVVKAAFIRHIERVIVPAGDHHAFLRYYLVQNAKRLKKRELLARYQAVITPFRPVKPRVPHLIVEATNDPLISERLRAILRATYPHAARYVFQGGGHFPYLNRPKAYNEMLSGFLTESGIAASPPSSTETRNPSASR